MEVPLAPPLVTRPRGNYIVRGVAGERGCSAGPTEPPRGFPVVVQILFGITERDAMLLQEAMDLVAGAEFKQAADLGFGKPARTIALEGEAFESRPRDAGSETAGN